MKHQQPEKRLREFPVRGKLNEQHSQNFLQPENKQQKGHRSQKGSEQLMYPIYNQQFHDQDAITTKNAHKQQR